MDSRVQYPAASRQMSYKQLTTVSDFLVVARFLYVLPAWGGFLCADLINRINALLRRLHRSSCQDEIVTITDLTCKSSYILFQQICRPDHPLNQGFADMVLVHSQVTIIFIVSVCLSVCLFVCAEFFSAVFDSISIKLGHMLYVWV